MAAPLYARYIPPKPAAAKPTGVTASPTPTSKPSAAEDVPKDKVKRVKDRPKKRKRENEDTREDQESEEVSKKYKSVFSKFEKSSKLADAARKSSKGTAVEELHESPAPELHDLTPLPQPAPVPDTQYEPTFSALPPWLAKPITVSLSTKTPFKDLNLDPKLVDQLEKKGYKDALAVQSAVLPLLRPGFQRHVGDVCVSAATGSGKTLAYILPMIESLQGKAVTKLSGLIVVPTRELVSQARTVAKQLCVGTKLKVGTAVGNVPFLSEQELIVKKGSRYDPDAAKALHEVANEQLHSGFIEKSGLLHDLMYMLPGHVPHYESKVDILICTPGRLVEHIQSTTGFHLRDVRWLVIDEADRLLDQSFQEWVDILMSSLESRGSSDQLSDREKIFSQRRWPKEAPELTKIVLSATMTRDLAKLGSLKLRRPKLVLVESDENVSSSLTSSYAANRDGGTFELPPTLKEWAIPVGEGLDKPLYLLSLLQSTILQEQKHAKLPSTSRRVSPSHGKEGSDLDSDELSSSDSPSSGSTSSDSQDSQAPVSDSSDSSDSSSSDDSESNSSSPARSNDQRIMPNPKNKTKDVKASAGLPRVLIFTNNNENASRLSHLLGMLHPPLKETMAALTKSSTTKSNQKMLAAFERGKFRILIASDRASRGLDVPSLTQVVNYDLPRSVTNYVHRVGRTARVGREGQAWTLFTKREGRWFWNEIARSPSIRRGGRKVERAKVDAEAVGDERRTVYEDALRMLQLAVEGSTERAI
ncbi:P-loop containing nucleoside triphosphate hydrolase protein [Glonium stellatum]|uniref:ATP-dependent RNA helicase n=1 Tax=Glonium stellatum TaxID=574774 RepID=A0A8E2FAF9_9PEZI|nr:P-loop containing nucleoside triphosphate hydrolase protein [Glonium stellatum]